MEIAKILLVDDELYTVESLKYFLEKKGHEVGTALTGEECLKKIRANDFDVIFLDLVLPDINGMELLKKAMNLNVSMKIVLITAYGTIEKAVESIKLGAYDFITKPVDLNRLSIILENAFKERKLLEEKRDLISLLNEKIKVDFLVLKDKKMKEIWSEAEKIATSDATILITGETGVGKGVLAQYIHLNSKRKESPFVVVNCASIPENLLESEMFGHEKGAFTGAVRTKKGKFEVANGGTLLLDEVGDLELHLQGKLLHILEDRAVERVGGTKRIPIDVRVIAATNKDLGTEIEKGKFREDLYYRLNVLPIHIPPLRERRDDIPAFIDFFVEKYSRKYGKRKLRIPDSILKRLMNYDWPGNIRELKNFIERLILTIEGERVSEYHVMNLLNPSKEKEDSFVKIKMGTALKEIERLIIMKTLEYNRGKRKKTAEMLGISLRTLQYKLKESKYAG
ncbi:MAG: sigma-54-dependent Fis family transcriptional regulator [Thermotogae bacterium]|nr:sigma-54-dependent Fis family transcriptional regulator [Thermotogota bacterium]